MAAVEHGHLKHDLGIAFAGLPTRGLDRLSCTHSFNANKLREWCEQLNVLNISTAAPLFITLFQELAAARLGVKEIFDLYIVVRPTLVKVRDAVLSVYSKKRLQLTSQAKQAMELAHSLDRSVILMLKSILVDCVKIQSGSSIEHLTAMIGSHLFVYLSESYIRLNEFCISTPKGFWRECHSIYWFMVKCSCEKLELQQTEFKEYSDLISVDALYKGLLLYSIAEPCKYDRALQVDLYHMMVRLSSYTDLEQHSVEDGLFAVVLTEDLSHVPKRAVQDQAQLSVLYFDMQEVVDGLRAQPTTSFALTKNSRLEHLRDEFVETFTVEKYRKEKRHDIAQHAQCFFGLVQIHLFLLTSGKVGADPEEEQDFYASQQIGQAKLKSEEVIVKDTSQGGYCLETLERHRLGYSAGDLVFILMQDIDIMCVIRWTRLQSTGCFLLGVERLAEEVEAVEFLVMQETSDPILEKGLLFENDGIKMLLSRVAVQQGQSVQVNKATQRKIYGVGEVHWLVSGYVQTILKPLG